MVNLQLVLEKRVYPAFKLASLMDVLAEEGIDAAEVLRGSGITPSDLLESSMRISYRQLITIYRSALNLSHSPLLALKAGKRMNLTSCGIFGYALMSSATPQEAFDFAVKYQRVLGPAVSGSYKRENDSIVWSLAPIIADDPKDPLYRFALEHLFPIALNLLRDAIDPDLQLQEIRVTYDRPDHAAGAYEAYLGCPVLFNQSRDEIRLASRWFDQHEKVANPITNGVVREICEQELSAIFGRAGFRGRIYQILIENPRQFPDIDTLAGDMRMSARTLRRKLDAEGTSYRKILSEVRKHLALQYLRDTPMTNEEIADRLGYSDAANFRKAFRQWTHGQPSEFRKSAKPAIAPIPAEIPIV